MHKQKLALVLSSGGARGSAHVGVLKVLEQNDIVPDLIVGSSMGASVGGMYAAGISIKQLTAMWEDMNFGKVVKLLFPTIPWSGWSSGREVFRTVEKLVGTTTIEEIPIPFAAVATDLESGSPHMIQFGSLAKAIRASISVPGLFTPVWLDGHLLIDGGVADPMPIDIARHLGADKVIAVDVLVDPDTAHISGIPAPREQEKILGIIKQLGANRPTNGDSRRFYPSVFSVLFQMATIFQKRMSDMSVETDPPDIVIRPDFSPDPPCYSNVRSGIEAGEVATRSAISKILELANQE